MTKLEIREKLRNTIITDSETLAAALAALDATIADIDCEELRKGILPLVRKLGGEVVEHKDEDDPHSCYYMITFPDCTGEPCHSLGTSGKVPEGQRHIREVTTKYIEKHQEDLPGELSASYTRFISGVVNRFCTEKEAPNLYPIRATEASIAPLYVYFAGDCVAILRSATDEMEQIYTDAVVSVPFTVDGVNSLVETLAQFVALVDACKAMEAKSPVLVHTAYNLAHNRS